VVVPESKPALPSLNLGKQRRTVSRTGIRPAFHERRWVRRSDAVLDASLRERGRLRRLGKVANLSVQGCRIDVEEAMPVDAMAWITLPSLESRYSRIAWCQGGKVGLEFKDPLHPAVADMLISRGRG
jgi:hypothetical protein